MNDALKIFNLYLESTEQPTMTLNGSTKEWLLHGKRHREDGPAVEYKNGFKLWYLHGDLHRLNGPAIEMPNGTKSWYVHGKMHREDGPAVEKLKGHKEWFLNDVSYKSAEKWAEALLKQRNKPHDAAAVDAFLKTLLRKDIEMAL